MHAHAHKKPDTYSQFTLHEFKIKDKQKEKQFPSFIKEILPANIQNDKSDLISTFELITRVRVEPVNGWESGQPSCVPRLHILCVTLSPNPPVSQQSSWRGPPCASLTDQAAERHIDTPLRSFALWRKLNLLF